MAVDLDGNAYVTGSTMSVDFPTTPGAYATTPNGEDIFVTKLNASGTGLIYSTFLGGSGGESAYAIALDDAGQAYIDGITNSADYPVTAGAFDTMFNGGYTDAFVAKLSSGGDILLYSTYLGGSDNDSASSLVLDSSNSIYLTGNTRSPDFPVTAGAFDTLYGGGFYGDAFVAKLDATGDSMIYCTFLGGGSADLGFSIEVASTGEAYVAGSTMSSDFPTTPDAYDSSYNLGGMGIYGDAFVAILTPTGDGLNYSTFLGGSGDDVASRILLDSDRNMYVAGRTESDDYPTTAGAFDRVLGGLGDIFVTKFDPTGSTLNYSTYLGGSDWDNGGPIAIDALGNVYVAGWTMSVDFPVTADGFDTSPRAGQGIIAKLGSNGGTLLYGTYVGGGAADEYGMDIVLDPAGYVYEVGWTLSEDFPVTPGAFDTTYNGDYDTYVVKVLVDEEHPYHAPQVLSFTAIPAPEGMPVIFLANASDPDGDILTYSFDYESDGTFDASGLSNTASHTWWDDYTGFATVSVGDGKFFTEASTSVAVYNVPPSIGPDIAAGVTGNLTMRVEGEKWHDLNLTIHRDGVAVANASVVRTPGSPDDRTATIEDFTVDLIEGNLSAVVRYTPDDDQINGQQDWTNPAWLIFTAKDGSESKLQYTFNFRNDDTWIWKVDDLRVLLAGMNITFTATATDPGSDDLTFAWDWGDGSPATVTTYYNDGIGSDPYPSPGGVFPFTATDSQTHPITAGGTRMVTLTVNDGDGGQSKDTVNATISVFPTVRIISPVNGSRISFKTLTVVGISTNSTLVQVRVQGGEWKNATGVSNWQISFDISSSPEGAYIIEARSLYQTAESPHDSVSIELEAGDETEILTFVLVGLGVTGGAVGVAFLLVEPLAVTLLTLLAILAAKLRRKEDISDNEKRGLIRGYLAANPGANYASIRNDLKIARGTLVYHLYVLEKQEIIRSWHDGRLKRFALSSERIADIQPRITDIELIILQTLKNNPKLTQEELAEEIGVRQPTISYHMKRLIQLGFLKVERKGIRNHYTADIESDPIRKAVPTEGSQGE